MLPHSFHFVPAHKPRFFERLGLLPADRYIFDLEDAVPPAEKQAARTFLHEFLRARKSDHYFVRIHEAGNRERERDLHFLRGLDSVGLVISKFSGRASLEGVERSRGARGRPLIFLIESFASFSNLERALEGELVLPYGIGLGFEDMLSCVLHDADQLIPLLRHIRTTLAIWCRAHGVLAIDGMSSADESDPDFERLCVEGRSCGLHGKFSIHPRQVPIINRVFSASPESVRWAQNIASLTGLRDDFGYERSGDVIITPPKVKKARYILEQFHNKIL
ncbi:MAG TPA: aldolase/citrate lyase family protein [Verrucomicrobiota bacterium]|nr:hypothetical protein [Verrucomicrobiales bacterium]HRI11758.1 aldolase/citrate lyase family protein [Verrucomicrobiota bacterium]